MNGCSWALGRGQLVFKLHITCTRSIARVKISLRSATTQYNDMDNNVPSLVHIAAPLHGITRLLAAAHAHILQQPMPKHACPSFLCATMKSVISLGFGPFSPTAARSLQVASRGTRPWLKRPLLASGGAPVCILQAYAVAGAS